MSTERQRRGTGLGGCLIVIGLVLLSLVLLAIGSVTAAQTMIVLAFLALGAWLIYLVVTRLL